MLASVISQMYAVIGVLLVLSYIPQIISVWKDRQGARTLSLPTWGFWVVSQSVTLMYAIVVVQSTVFIAASVGCALGTYTTFAVGAWRRLKYKKQAGNTASV